MPDTVPPTSNTVEAGQSIRLVLQDNGDKTNVGTVDNFVMFSSDYSILYDNGAALGTVSPNGFLITNFLADPTSTFGHPTVDLTCPSGFNAGNDIHLFVRHIAQNREYVGNFNVTRGGAGPVPPQGNIDAIFHIGDSITAGVAASDTAHNAVSQEAAIYASQGRVVSEFNAGVSGTQTSDWLPGSQRMNDQIYAINRGNYGTCEIMLGTNDAPQHVSTAIYLSNMNAIIAEIKSKTSAQTVIVFEIPANTAWQQDWLASIRDYNANLNTLVGCTVRGQGVYDVFAANAGTLLAPDNVHPNDAGNEVLAEFWTGTYAVAAPAIAPTGFAIAAPQFAVSWAAVIGATGYRLRRDGDATPIYDGPLLTFLDSFISGVHSYTVAAYNARGEGPQSPVSSAGFAAVVPARRFQ